MDEKRRVPFVQDGVQLALGEIEMRGMMMMMMMMMMRVGLSRWRGSVHPRSKCVELGRCRNGSKMMCVCVCEER